MRSPPREIVAAFYPEIYALVERVNQLYWIVPFRVSSWWRDVDSNALASGAMYSQHLIATAADLVPLSPYSKADLARAARQVGLIPVNRYKTHVHVQAFRAGFLERWLGIA